MLREEEIDWAFGADPKHRRVTDWRMDLAPEDRYSLRPIMEAEVDRAGINLVAAIRKSTPMGGYTQPFWAEAAYVLARRAHRYARLLEVLQ
jgi:hypothetical protein